MSDDLEARGHHAITHNGETYIKLADASVTFSLYRKDIAAKDAEITRLRAEFATARREGMEEAAKIVDATAHANRVEYPKKWKDRPQGIPHDWSVSWETCAETAEEIAAAIRAAAEEDRPSEEIIREDRDSWPDHQANDPIRAAAGEGKP